MGSKLLVPLSGVVTGILLSSELLPGLAIGSVTLGLAILVWIFLTIVSKDPVKGTRFKNLHFIWIGLLFVSIGSLDFYFFCQPENPENLKETSFAYTARIDEVKYLSHGDQFETKILNIKDGSREIPFKNLKVLIKTDGFLGHKGDIITFSTKLKSIKDANIDEVFAERMRHKGISFQANIRYDKIIKTGETHSIVSFLSDYRDKLIILIENSSLDRASAEFLISILLGDRLLLSNDFKQALSLSGLAHILALSGLHVGIFVTILSLLFFPLRFLGSIGSEKILIIVVIWSYVLLTGASPSTMRAAIMASFVMTALMLQRKNSPINALMGATIIILLLDPLSLWDIGLQLSFLCVSAILLFKDNLNPIEHHSHPFIYKVVDAVLIVIIATFTTWIVVAFYFKNIPLLFLPSNILLLPLIPVIFGAGLIYLILLMFGIDSALIAKIIEGCHDLLLKASDFFSFSGQSSINISVPLVSVLLWLAAIVCIVFFFKISGKKEKWYSIVTGISLFICSFVAIGFFQPKEYSGLKFPHSFTKMEAHVLIGGKIEKIEFPRTSVSESRVKNNKIVSIDAPVKNTEIEKLYLESSERHFLLLGPGSDRAQCAELINKNIFDKVILHSGYGKNNKTELLRLVNENLWDKIYSLRDYGSLELEL